MKAEPLDEILLNIAIWELDNQKSEDEQRKIESKSRIK